MSVHERTAPAGPREDIVFESFRLDRRGGRLLHRGEPVPLRPKTWAVLLYLAERPGMLVSKDELLDAVWPDVAVTPDTLTKSIGELRVALGDDSRAPRCIETVHRRGFRFIAVDGDGRTPATARWSAQEPGAVPFVGRAAEIERLRELFGRASSGERQIAFVTGPAGVGKTTLLDAFLRSAEVRRQGESVWIGRGACVEQHGSREPYMPVLDALGRLAKRPDAGRLVELLPRVAPTWLAQMPWLVGDDDRTLLGSLQSARPERMLREFAALVEALSERVTLLLVLEDLHWSDPSTVDLLSVLSQRQETARLFVLATYRPAELAVHEHVLARAVRMLQVRRQCVEIPVHELDGAAVRDYLEARFPGLTFAAELAPTLLRYTDGTPLFLVGLVEHFLSRGWIVETSPGWALTIAPQRTDLGVPDDARRVIDSQLEILGPSDRTLLEVASVAGNEFAVPLLAAAVPCGLDEAEARCEALARAHRFLRPAREIEWPDGGVAQRFAFAHELYRRAAYAEIPEGVRQRLHQRMGEALERAYGPRTAEIAAELAAHFEQARDDARAVRYLAAAASRARQRFASREVIDYLESAVAATARLPRGESEVRELELRLALAPVLNDLYGFGSAPLRRNFERAHVLCKQVGTPEQLFAVAVMLCHLSSVQGDTDSLGAGLARLDELAEQLGTRWHRIVVESARLRSAFNAGRLPEVLRTGELFFAAPSVMPPAPAAPAAGFGAEPFIAAQAQFGLALWMHGSVARARDVARAAVAAARASSSPFTLAAALSFSAIIEVLDRDADAARAPIDEAVELSEGQGFVYWRSVASALRAWVGLQRGEAREALRDLENALAAIETTGVVLFTSYVQAFMAEAHAKLGQNREALLAIDRALACAETDRSYTPELWRRKGELLLAAARPAWTRSRRGSGAVAEAEACFARAVELARRREARLFELRAAGNLARSLAGRGCAAEAAAVLAAACGSFEGEPPNPELLEAKDLLAEISRGL